MQPAAAGHFHPHDSNALDIVVPDDRGQFIRIVHIIQLGAANDCDLAFHELLVHIGIGVRRAVCRDQQLRTVKERSLCRYQLDLAGPLVQAGDRAESCHRSFGRRHLRFPLKLHHTGSGTPAGRMSSVCCQMSHHSGSAFCFVLNLHNLFC